MGTRSRRPARSPTRLAPERRASPRREASTARRPPAPTATGPRLLPRCATGNRSRRPAPRPTSPARGRQARRSQRRGASTARRPPAPTATGGRRRPQSATGFRSRRLAPRPTSPAQGLRARRSRRRGARTAIPHHPRHLRPRAIAAWAPTPSKPQWRYAHASLRPHAAMPAGLGGRATVTTAAARRIPPRERAKAAARPIGACDGIHCLDPGRWTWRLLGSINSEGAIQRGRPRGGPRRDAPGAWPAA